MIEKIRKALIIKYTLIIAGILFLGFAASYTAYRHNGIKLLQDGLHNYLTEEVWEAEKHISNGPFPTEIHKIKSDVKSLHNFTYWVVDKKIIHAEQPESDVITRQLEQRLLSKTYEDGVIYHENMKQDKQKWYFIVIKQTLPADIVKNGEVFVLANYTPIRKSTKAYVKIALTVAVIMILLAYLIGSSFAARSMKYIEKSYEKQKRFVSDAAHELRTPLAILYSNAELLEYNPQKKEVIRDIKNEIEQMNDLVDKLLSIAKYDNSSVVIRKETFCINKTLAGAVKAMKKLCPPETFTLVGCNQDIAVTADKVMIKQLMTILLDNAIKYTPKNKKITVSLSKQPSTVKISVKDNGTGIKEENLPYIFDRFWREEKSRHQKGLGLGLSLAASIIKLHNGSVSVNSVQNQGTTFEITLPLK